MSKKWYFIFVINTLVLIAPYLWLIFDIVDQADYDKLLIDACFAGPCLILAEMMWLFIRRVKKHNIQSDEEGE